MNNTPRAERMNIVFVGKTNVGKSSIINKLVGQDVSIISEQPGTTTDPVSKRYELNPVGPVTFFDTAGYDDKSFLGKKRFAATMKVIYKADLAVLVTDNDGLSEADILIINELKNMKVPFFVVCNKIDIGIPDESSMTVPLHEIDVVPFSAYSEDINSIREKISAHVATLKKNEGTILRDMVKKDDLVILVVPIDSAAPQGRIILPQVQVLREILNIGAIAICCTEKELSKTMSDLNVRPKFIITDSQSVNFVHQIVPQNIPLTTFSILFARYRGELETLLKGISILKNLKEDDEILIAEACSHHVTCEDIVTVKIPSWIDSYLGFVPQITKFSGNDFPDDLKKYKLVIHCGGCMISRTEMLHRINLCDKQKVAITNFGMLISELHGVLDRVIKEIL